MMLDTFNAVPEMMITHNAAFIQAIAQAIYARPTTPTAQQEKEIYSRYLTDRRLVPYVMKAEFGEAKRHYPNWEDSSAANYVLFAGNQSAHAMLISQNDLESLLGTDKSAHDHRDYHVYNGGVSVGRHDYYWETLRQEAFPLFQSGYLRRLSEKNIIDVMAHLYLNTALERLFMASTQQAYSSVKLVRPEKQLAMNELWANRVYQFDANDHCTLDDGFYQRLMTLALLATAPPVERAQILFCLAAVFAKCASSSLFGTEEILPMPYAVSPAPFWIRPVHYLMASPAPRKHLRYGKIVCSVATVNSHAPPLSPMRC
ncbi:hypothetical protein JZM24_15790 [Candidatus Sodalis endolongispinus]|uniref:E3 ubiquitin-protein ligase SopA n=1 Tax=Candidatus Sodalis endolongispinus TaxID=2812662 RepID=A0ABS5YE20_9GAMM|nr:hypothetical protein [Candidatus Sodalis endolongispinus]